MGFPRNRLLYRVEVIALWLLCVCSNIIIVFGLDNQLVLYEKVILFRKFIAASKRHLIAAY